MVEVEYKKAYKEILEILKYMSEEDVNKIPKEMLELFIQNANRDYEFQYNPDKTLQEQNVSKKARYIIAILFRDYWATELQREKIIKKEESDMQKIEEELRKKYNTDNLFKKNDVVKERNDDIEIKELIEYKEDNIFRKILSKIISLFNKKI